MKESKANIYISHLVDFLGSYKDTIWFTSDVKIYSIETIPNIAAPIIKMINRLPSQEPGILSDVINERGLFNLIAL